MKEVGFTSVALISVGAHTLRCPPITLNVIIPSLLSAMSVIGLLSRTPDQLHIDGLLSSVNDVTCDVPGNESPARVASSSLPSASTISTHW